MLEEAPIQGEDHVESQCSLECSDEVSDPTWRDLFFGFKAIAEEECIHEHTISVEEDPIEPGLE